MEKAKPHFAKLGSKEINELLEMAVRQQVDLIIWQKKDNIQETARASDFDIESSTLSIRGGNFAEMTKAEVLVNFRFANRMYFSTATLDIVDDKSYIKFTSDIFKCEQRRDFRLPSNESRKIAITIDGECYNASDVSVTGIGIVVDAEQSLRLKVNSGFDNVLLQIGSRQFNIPFCKIVHARDHLLEEKTKLIGVEFIEISRPLEVELYKTINNLLYKELKD